MSEDNAGGDNPLAAGLHADGSVRVYVRGKDSGLRISLDPKTDELVIKVDESARCLR